ncbi:hypothetical protein MLD38_018934 [Melastoma candidum]|uniref:Uncharacterized protein n=1 Tax=Melastoma candidum TaxID=119954 RepID=A0ACB9QYG1_9MYRT|nr:hypothetical protein MLD38_018934 [Melastoma candidum]
MKLPARNLEKESLLGPGVMRRYSPESYSPPRRGYGGRDRSPPRRGYGGGGGGGGYGRRGDRGHGSLLVRNIPLDCRPDELRMQFERFGIVRDVYLPRDYYTGEPRGFAFVEFVDPQDAADAQYHMDGKSFAGRRISVVVAAESRKRPEEMRHRSGTRGSSGYGGRRANRGRSGSRSPSRSPSPRHQSGSRNRKRSRSYSPAPRRRGDYSASPRRGHADDRLRSPPAPLEEQPGKRGSPRSPSYYKNGYSPGDKERESNRERSSDRAYRSPSGSRSRSVDGDALPVRSP